METAEQRVVAVLGELVGAWNAGDADAYGALFTEDADYVTFFGVNMPGRKAITEGHRALFQGPLKGSKLDGGGAPSKVRFLRPDVAVVVVGGGSTLPGADAARDSTLTYVLVEEAGAWRIASFQNTRVSDPRAAA
jgi:uncharacterized protein (TIGR02246 family)